MGLSKNKYLLALRSRGRVGPVRARAGSPRFARGNFLSKPLKFKLSPGAPVVARAGNPSAPPSRSVAYPPDCRGSGRHPRAAARRRRRHAWRTAGLLPKTQTGHLQHVSFRAFRRGRVKHAASARFPFAVKQGPSRRARLHPCYPHYETPALRNLVAQYLHGRD